MNAVRQCLVLIPHDCIGDNILAKCPAECTPFFWIKGPENKHSNVMPTVFHIWTWGCQSCVATCQIWMILPSVFIRDLLLWVAANVIKGRLFFINWDCFTKPRIFVLHLCWPLNCYMDGWGTVFIVLLGNPNRWRASLKNLQWCRSASFWYDIWFGPLQIGNELVRAKLSFGLNPVIILKVQLLIFLHQLVSLLKGNFLAP